MNNAIERVLLTEDTLKNEINKLGKILAIDYKDKTPLFVCVLKGSVVFFADLIRCIDIDCRIDFIMANSYGNSTKSSGSLKILKDLSTDIKNKHVVLIEDIFDSGITLYSLVNMLKERNPASIKTVTLLEKNIQRSIDFEADYKCFDIEDQFVVGYGLDYNERYRNLPYVGVLKKSIYE